ncbi:hypothetical protein ACHAXT_007221 [Thalassiosira profunda]
MISPQHTSLASLRQLYQDCQPMSSSKMVTPPLDGPATISAEQWVARQMGMPPRASEEVSPMDRAEVSSAVYGILRDNMPPSLEATTSHDDLALIADSIENRLHQTAPSPRAYKSLATLEMRLTALATAVLLHSNHNAGTSDACVNLAAAARRSLPHCATVLVSYEKRSLEQTRQSRAAERAAAYVQRLDAVDRRALEYPSLFAGRSSFAQRRRSDASHDTLVSRMVEEWQAQRVGTAGGTAAEVFCRLASSDGAKEDEKKEDNEAAKEDEKEDKEAKKEALENSKKVQACSTSA